MYSSKMFDQNPWWEDASNIRQDPHIRAQRESGLRWSPRICFEGADLVYSLRGTRQVGKTTTVKTDICQRLNSCPGRAVMYYAFDLERDPGDVVEIVERYLDFSADLDEWRFLYLDEVTSVRNWQKAIKYLKDSGKLENCTVIIVGSNSIDMRRGTEMLPGRRGLLNKPLDLIQEPMKFSDYVATINRDLGAKIKKYRERGISAICKLADGNITDEVRGASVFLSTLNRHLDEYFVVGGMPIAVTAFMRRRTIPDGVYKTYLDSVTGDLKSAGSNITYVGQLMPGIIKSTGSAVSWRSLSRETDIGSHHTIPEYVMTLADVFVLNVVYRYDMTADRPKYDGMKKIYFRDPLFLHAWNAIHHQESIFRYSVEYAEEPDIKPKIAEQTVASHITRLAFDVSKNPVMYSDQLSVFYWRGKNGNEVDFAVRMGDGIMPIEVKYKNRIRTGDIRGMMDMVKIGAFLGGLILTRDELGTKGGAVMIPLAVFLALI